jgi:hypothetical protein
MGGMYCYVYDDISKYWCTQTTEEHDADGSNHICDYADSRVVAWAELPKVSIGINALNSFEAFMSVANQHRPYEPSDFVKEYYLPDL